MQRTTKQREHSWRVDGSRAPIAPLPALLPALTLTLARGLAQCGGSGGAGGLLVTLRPTPSRADPKSKAMPQNIAPIPSRLPIAPKAEGSAVRSVEALAAAIAERARG